MRVLIRVNEWSQTQRSTIQRYTTTQLLLWWPACPTVSWWSLTAAIATINDDRNNEDIRRIDLLFFLHSICWLQYNFENNMYIIFLTSIFVLLLYKKKRRLPFRLCSQPIDLIWAFYCSSSGNLFNFLTLFSNQIQGLRATPDIRLMNGIVL